MNENNLAKEISDKLDVLEKELKNLLIRVEKIEDYKK